ncbi:uncharacterized protein LOC143509925 [Brachyhypopomus gauderio]|uniref:uncharacterized protein LOC143509925 n=1 Tax=Brachyhypopomus gauderio TaxID=698409 RepID=UPI0040415610
MSFYCLLFTCSCFFRDVRNLYIYIWTAFSGQYIRFLFVLVGSVLGSELMPCTRVALNDSATLTCTEQCVGETQWKRGRDTVAQCGPDPHTGLQFTCTADQERSSLTVPQVNYSTRGYYYVFCDGREMPLCRQLLQPLPDQSTLALEAGQHLRMDFHTSDPVIVTVRKHGNSSSMQVCTVDGRVKQCHPDYQDRVHIHDNTFVLMEVMPSDSGSYTVKEKEGITVSFFNVTVKGISQSYIWHTGYWAGFCHGATGFGVGMLVVGVLLAKFTLLPVFGRRELNPRRSNQEGNGLI